jgi:hypothetical protein
MFLLLNVLIYNALTMHINFADSCRVDLLELKNLAHKEKRFCRNLNQVKPATRKIGNQMLEV